MSETGLDEQSAQILMSRANDDLRVAIVMQKAKINRETAADRLAENDFVIEKAVKSIK
jgi:N-acetylmuramic acid 6-phosphate (MurNAc-6-P) etherase